MPAKKPESLTTMPLHFTVISLDPIGYPGWVVTMRLNVRARTYDDFLSQDRELFWAAFGQIVLEWNLVDEEGQPLPLPKDGLGARDLPIDILNTLVLRYVEAMADSAAIPKARDANSETSSRINGVAQSGAPA
jgi:hypothetical protein